MAQSATPGFGIDADWSEMYVGGEWVPAGDRGTISVENPATGEVVHEVPAGTAADVDDAFQAAAAAQEAWADRPPQDRAEVVQNAMALLDQHADALTELMVAESGSTVLKAALEVEEATMGMLAESASFPMRSQGSTSESTTPGKRNEVTREPAGVVGVISPWNFPLHLAVRSVAPALALGNAVVLKPDENTPAVGGLAVARLFEAAGLPGGLLNVVTGRGEPAGERVAANPELDVLSFTGSTEVGRHVGGLAAENLARPALELGGNAPFVVLDDADIDEAIDAGVFGSFVHQGQVCIAISRHIVHESLYDEYVERLAERAAALPVGDPSNPENALGPVINQSQRDRMMDFLERSVEAGATIEAGGDYEDLFVEPTVVSGVTNDIGLGCNEQFGPVAPVIEAESNEEAVKIANDTDKGLSAAVFGEQGHARRVADRIEAGMVHVNDMSVNEEPHTPFGGVNDSGLGRYNGEWIIEEFTETKWISVQEEPREYPF
ncbi:aldehyde dehydrogenase family protein [Salinirussus salinus]|uniref:aldehyde dehydrogenase family protein n=1 Tax=Salinirussus salinus TaxID=1198300 RepID=UPI001357D214|nr:aldehyde dehydrogenase family protein [Salinirussus salinus]